MLNQKYVGKLSLKRKRVGHGTCGERKRGGWLAEGDGRDATALWKDVRCASEFRHLRYIDGGQ